MADGGEERTSVTGAGAIVIDSVPFALCGGVPESVAVRVRVNVPAAVGVPLTTHPLPRVNPGGNAPEEITHE